MPTEANSGQALQRSSSPRTQLCPWNNGSFPKGPVHQIPRWSNSSTQNNPQTRSSSKQQRQPSRRQNNSRRGDPSQRRARRQNQVPLILEIGQSTTISSTRPTAPLPADSDSLNF